MVKSGIQYHAKMGNDMQWWAISGNDRQLHVKVGNSGQRWGIAGNGR